jgi:hypothetical protein
VSNPYDPLPEAPKDFTLKEALKPTVTDDGHFHCGKLDFPDSATYEDFKSAQTDLGGTKEQLATLHFIETTGKPPNTQPMNAPPKGTNVDDLLDITVKEPQKDGYYHLGTLRVKPEEYTQFRDLQKTMCAKNPEALAALYHMENQPEGDKPVTYRMTKDDDRHARYDDKSNTIFVNSHSAGRDEGSGVVLPPATAGMHEEAHWGSRKIIDTLNRIPDKDMSQFADRSVIEGAEARDLQLRGLNPRHGHNTLMVPVEGLESTQATLTIKQDGGQRESRSPFQQSGRVMEVKDGWVKLAVRGDGAKPEHQMEFKLDQVATAMGQDSVNARRLLEGAKDHKDTVTFQTTNDGRVIYSNPAQEQRIQDHPVGNPRFPEPMTPTPPPTGVPPPPRQLQAAGLER